MPPPGRWSILITSCGWWWAIAPRSNRESGNWDSAKSDSSMPTEIRFEVAKDAVSTRLCPTVTELPASALRHWCQTRPDFPGFSPAWDRRSCAKFLLSRCAAQAHNSDYEQQITTLPV